MPSIPLYTTPFSPTSNASSPINITNPLPTLLQTPSGLALLEIQGSIHAPFPSPITLSPSSPPKQTPVGRLEFPLHEPSQQSDGKAEGGEGEWMKKVYLYVGKHQRLTGEVKRLPKAMAVIRRREGSAGEDGEHVGHKEGEEELEVVDIVRWKVLFAGRPEPVGGNMP